MASAWVASSSGRGAVAAAQRGIPAKSPNKGRTQPPPTALGRTGRRWHVFGTWYGENALRRCIHRHAVAGEGAPSSKSKGDISQGGRRRKAAGEGKLWSKADKVASLELVGELVKAVTSDKDFQEGAEAATVLEELATGLKDGPTAAKVHQPNCILFSSYVSLLSSPYHFLQLT